jgi:hypothetical protein
MKFSLESLTSLTNKKKVMSFDCEFWHILGQEGHQGIKFQPNEDFFFIPREIGGLILDKTGSEWKLRPPFFVTLYSGQKDTVLPISKFSTVTSKTAEQLDQIERRLGRPWGEAFYSRLSEDGQAAFKEGMKVYVEDSNIKKHHKPPSWYKTFMKEYSESVIIVKGTGDIDALKNAALLYGFKYLDPLDIVDISDWNPTSHKVCGTAKLAGTFDCIKRDLPKEVKHLADYLPLEKAHDPSTDASMTLLIALYIQSQKP